MSTRELALAWLGQQPADAVVYLLLRVIVPPSTQLLDAAEFETHQAYRAALRSQARERNAGPQSAILHLAAQQGLSAQPLHLLPAVGLEGHPLQLQALLRAAPELAGVEWPQTVHLIEPL